MKSSDAKGRPAATKNETSIKNGTRLHLEEEDDFLIVDNTSKDDADGASSIGTSIYTHNSNLLGVPGSKRFSVRVVGLADQKDLSTDEDDTSASLDVPIGYPPPDGADKETAARESYLYVFFHGCLPGCIRRAPDWLKVFLLASVLLMSASIVLACVGVVLSKSDGQGLAASSTRVSTGVIPPWDILTTPLGEKSSEEADDSPASDNLSWTDPFTAGELTTTPVKATATPTTAPASTPVVEVTPIAAEALVVEATPEPTVAPVLVPSTPAPIATNVIELTLAPSSTPKAEATPIVADILVVEVTPEPTAPPPVLVPSARPAPIATNAIQLTLAPSSAPVDVLLPAQALTPIAEEEETAASGSIDFVKEDPITGLSFGGSSSDFQFGGVRLWTLPDFVP